MWSYAVGAPREFVRLEVPTPEAGDLVDGQVLLRTLAGGICGSDFFAFEGQGLGRGRELSNPCPLPGHPLHEVVGEVLASRHPRIAVGSRVVGWAWDLNALAERVIVYGDDLSTYDTDMVPTTAVMLQPLACVLYAVDQIDHVAGADAAVIGQGPIGVLFSHVLKSRGAARVRGVDLVSRGDVSAVFGVDESVHSSSERWSMLLTDDDRPRIVVEAVGHQATTLDDAIRAVAPKGQIYYFGIPTAAPLPLNLLEFLRKNLTLRSGVTLTRGHYIDVASEYLTAHPELVDAYVTHTFDVTDVQKAFDQASRPTRGQLKVTLNMA
jgi:L-iditol 2-dehydrogenase